MYLMQILNKEQIENNSIISPMLTAKQLDAVIKCEVWATNFKDNEEYCEFQFFNTESYYPFLTTRMNGY